MSDIRAEASTTAARAQIDLAGRLDAEGQHEEAINCLARAAGMGDAEALTVLGLRLVTGQNAPFLPADGARLLSDAVHAGGAAAAGHLAVLVGGGFHARQSWDQGLDLLQRSAELGSSSAATQLRILAGAAGRQEESGSEAWADLRRRVDLSAWTGPPSISILSKSPSVRSVSGLVPPSACAFVIGQSQARLVGAELYDPETAAAVLGQDTRLNRIANFGLADTCLLNLVIQARISAAAGLPMNQMEAFAVLHYAPGEEYGEHFDFLDPAIPAYGEEIERAGQRVATCLLYLSEGYEGGETEFPRLGIRYKGRTGDALIFHSTDEAGRPDVRSLHAGRPPTSGEKWLLSQFFRSRPVISLQARPH